MKKLLVSSFLAVLLSSTAFAGDVSAYESAGFKDVNSVKSGLKSSGFSVVGEYDAMGNPNYHVIVYTNADMKATAAKEDLGFAAVQKVLVSKKDKELVFTNPEYFLHAFLEDEYNEENAKKINSALKAAFGALKGSNDALDDDDIAGYHFMMGMPYYEDMIEVAKGKDLLQKLEKNAGGNIVFKVNLKNGVLAGIAMPKEEKSYVPAIKGQENTAFLPYMVLVEDNEAKIMHPKYYLAVSYPKLSMGDFMSISSTPDDIEDYMKGLFK